MKMSSAITISFVVNSVFYIAVYIFNKRKRENLNNCGKEKLLYDFKYTPIFIIDIPLAFAFMLNVLLVLGNIYSGMVNHNTGFIVSQTILLFPVLLLYKLYIFKILERLVREFVIIDGKIYIKTLLHNKLLFSFKAMKYCICFESIDKILFTFGHALLLTDNVFIFLKNGQVIKVYQCIGRGYIEDVLSPHVKIESVI